MTFQKIYKVKDVDGKTCLVTKEGLNNAKENYMLYFARKSGYGHHGDTPVIGVGSDYVKRSEVEGPFAAPVSENNYFDGGDEIRVEPIKLVLSEIPVFVPVELLTFGVDETVSLNWRSRISPYITRVSEFAERAFETFKRKATNVQQTGTRWLTGKYFGRIVLLEHHQFPQFDDEQLSYFKWTMFGAPLTIETSVVRDQLGINTESGYYLGITQKTSERRRKGLAFNLDLSAINVDQASQLENVIL